MAFDRAKRRLRRITVIAGLGLGLTVAAVPAHAALPGHAAAQAQAHAVQDPGQGGTDTGHKVR